jgi:hypothetical protein
MLAFKYGTQEFHMRSSMALRFRMIRRIYHLTCRSMYYGQNASKLGTKQNRIDLKEFDFQYEDLKTVVSLIDP